MELAFAWAGALLLGAIGAGVVVLWTGRAPRSRGASGRADEAPLWYWLRRGSLPQGPVPVEQLLAMHLDGRLGDDVVVARAGSDAWQPIDRLAAERRHGGRSRRPQP